jgi:hypothetical protein
MMIMKRNFFFGLLAGLGLLLLVAFRPATNDSNVGVQKWEYKVIRMTLPAEKRETDFNALGQEGWELVSNSESYAHFKRAVQ